MATADRDGSDHLTHLQRLIDDPQSHHIFLALRILEAHYKDAPRLGQSRRPSQDKVRLGQDPNMAFAPSAIDGFTPQGAAPARLTNRFFGFYGPHGPLPIYMTDYAYERKVKHRDKTLVGFTDMLTHRMMSLFYRAWVSGAPAVDLDRGQGTTFEAHVAALAGHHGSSFQNRDAMPDMAKRFFAGHLAAGVKNASGLVTMLRSFFDFPVTCREFVGSWLELEPEDHSHLGQSGRLGENITLGAAVWTRTAKFRLIVGPLDLPAYERMLPGQPSMQRMADLVRNYLGDTLAYDVNVLLRGDQVPRACLDGGTRLGQTSWLGQRPTDKDADDLFLDVQSHLGQAA